MTYIDLTQTISSIMPGVQINQSKWLDKDGWNANDVTLYSHSGTHVDAPVHFGMPGPFVDQLPFERLISEAWVCDLSHVSPSALIEPEDLGSLAGEFKTGDSLILRTGWSKYIGNPDIYRNKLPRISENLARWLVQMKTNILAVEPPSVADVNNIKEVTTIHQLLFSGQIIIVEGICNVDLIPVDKVELMIFPLKLKNGDGAPARVLAKIP